MANYERAELAHPHGTLYTLAEYRSTTNPPSGAVIAGSTAWPTITIQSEDIDGGGYTEQVIPAALAKMVDGAWVAATPEDIAAHLAAIETAATAAAVERLAIANEAFGPMVEELRTNLVELGYDLPCDSATVTAELLQRSRAGELTAEQEQAKGDLADLYIMLGGKGVDDDAIAAVWAYRVTQ